MNQTNSESSSASHRPTHSTTSGDEYWYSSHANDNERKTTKPKTDEEEEVLGKEEDGEEVENGYGPSASFDYDWRPFEGSCKTTQLIFKKKSGKTITRLKQPRDLYALSKQLGTQMAPRWPAEVQVLAQRPRHIRYFPTKPEPLAKTVKDMKPPPRSSDIFGKVVYDNSPDPEVKYFTRSKVGGKTIPPKPYYRLQGSDDKTLLFESRFESGNLMRAIKVDEFDYELWLRFDLYTKKHTQWYYFRVQNARPGVQYRFTIMNFLKPGSLYNQGMRPLIYSELDAKTKSIGWVRAGNKIKYYRNDIKFEEGNKERYYYSLTWSCSFPNENDTYYFAHCYPYTYSDLQEYLAALVNDPVRSRCCKQRILCRTLAGNFVYVLTITSPTKRREEAESKRAVVLTARVHPGETQASWMMKGFLDFLTSNALDAKILRDSFVFKIVPMLNPDGVVVGNYRCSLAGRDLNRNYKTVLKDSFPSVWFTRSMIKKLVEEREVIAYCDLHGHSRKQNVFIYGCEDIKANTARKFMERVFPFMLAKNAKDKFSYEACKFKVQKSKATFCGSSLGNRNGYHFTVADFESMAYHFCDTLLDFCDPDQSKVQAILRELEFRIRSVILQKIRQSGNTPEDVEVNIDEDFEFLSDIETDSGGSDSSVSDGLPMQLLHASVPELTRKKRLKSRKERNKRRIKAMRMREAHSSGATAKNDSFQKDGQEIKIGRKPLDLGRPSAKVVLQKMPAGVPDDAIIARTYEIDCNLQSNWMVMTGADVTSDFRSMFKTSQPQKVPK